MFFLRENVLGYSTEERCLANLKETTKCARIRRQMSRQLSTGFARGFGNTAEVAAGENGKKLSGIG